MELEFEWDPKKADANLKQHRVSFLEASQAFSDPKAVEFFDDINSDAEIRFRLVGFLPKRLLFVSYTYRNDDFVRIISARKATAVEKRYYKNA